MSQTALDRTLRALVEKGLAARSLPYSATATPKNTRYLIADPYMRFWLRFVGPSIDLIERGRGQLAGEQVLESWPTYRGAAIEPTIRDSLERMLPAARFGKARYVGSYWNRTHTVQVDLVGGDTRPVARHVELVGSVKWRTAQPFEQADSSALIAGRAQVPGAGDTTRLVGVSRSGFSHRAGLDVQLSAEDLLDAWRP